MAREVHLRASVKDDGSVDLLRIFREEKGGEPLTPEEWEQFKASIVDRLPGLIDCQSENENRLMRQ